MIYESENTEFKSQLVDDIYKEIVAFANTDGGVIYLGLDNEGRNVGVENVDDTYTRLTNGVRDAIHPDVTMSVRYALQDDNTIRIEVGEGSYKPYYLKSKGIRPAGVYVRQGASSVQASSDHIRRMIKESDGDCYEKGRSLDQSLTFDFVNSVFGACGMEFSPEKYRGLGMTRDGIYTKLAQILSDQCLHTTRVAVYKDEFFTEFRDRKEFSGSVLKQFDDTVNYLALCNKTASAINGLVRSDSQDYPEAAIREALINAIVHRDYSYSGSIIININDRQIEFISLGGLLPGLSSEDIRIGISQPRNRGLAEIFLRLRLVESYGTGIRRIFKLYEGCPIQPEIITSANAFKIVLPNMNSQDASGDNTNGFNTFQTGMSGSFSLPASKYAGDGRKGLYPEINTGNSGEYSRLMKAYEESFRYNICSGLREEASVYGMPREPQIVITSQMKKVIQYLENHGEMTDDDLQILLGIKKTRSYLLSRQMSERGLIEITGRGAKKKLVLKTSGLDTGEKTE